MIVQRDQLALAYRSLILDGDQAGAEALVAEALLGGVPAAGVCADVLAPALRDVGWLWEIDELSIADEHMASEITTAVVLRVLTPEAPNEGPIAVVSCGPHGGHSIGGRIFSSLLMSRGWRVTFLGAQTPSAALERFVGVRKPDLLAYSLKLANQLPVVAEQIRRIRAAPDAPRVLVGGAAVTERPADLGADCVEDDLDAALDWVDRTFPQRAP